MILISKLDIWVWFAVAWTLGIVTNLVWELFTDKKKVVVKAVQPQIEVYGKVGSKFDRVG